MKRNYIIQVIEPDRKLNLNKLKYNFYIEQIKIITNGHKKRKKAENPCLFHDEL